VSATLTVLGAGSILPRAGYGCAGYALRPEPGGAVTLLDCGPGSIRALGAAEIALAEVRRVVFSHYHLDHCLDLFALAFARHNPALDEVGTIELVGPPGLGRLVEQAPAVLGRWARVPNAIVLELELDSAGGARVEAPDLELACRANGHTPEAVSWRVARPGGGWSLFYSGDTPEEPRLAELGADVDLFVCECSFPEESAAPNHLTPASAARLARAARARRLLLTHFYPGLDPGEARAVAERVFDGPVLLARDGAVFEID
jgi:ribonuclease BN (tRNA processing enzyme)